MAKSEQLYRNQLKELVEKAKDIYEQGKYKNPEYGELCMAVVRLIENSDFGRKEAESLSIEKNYNAFSRPVEARAGFELVKLIEKDVDVKNLGTHGFSNYSGIYVPTETLSSIIYVPKPILEHDKNLKKQNEYAGIILFHADQLNLFYSEFDVAEDKKLIEKILYGPKPEEQVSWWKGIDIFNQLIENSLFRKEAKLYSTRMLEICRKKAKHTTLELQSLLLQFIDMYSSEMKD